jgi:hypothetical protein
MISLSVIKTNQLGKITCQHRFASFFATLTAFLKFSDSLAVSHESTKFSNEILFLNNR